MTPERRRKFVLAAAAAITDEPEVAHLLAKRNERKERVGSASIDALGAVAATNPDSFDRRAFCVRVADDLLVLDADTDEAAHVALEVADRAEGVGLDPVVVSSGRPGNLHVYVRVVDERLRTTLSELASAGGVDVRTGNWVRPPLSVHPDGVHGKLLSPTDPDEALRRLARPAGFEPPEPAPKPLVLAPEIPAGAPRRTGKALSAQMVRVLRDGDGNPDRSVTLQRVVTAMVNAGWSIDDAWAELAKPTSKCAAKLHEKIRTKGDGHAYSYLEHCWRSAQEFCAENPAVGRGDATAVTDALDRLSELIDTIPWPGAAGSSNWMVLHQMIEVAREAGTLTPTISQRQLVERTSLARGTIQAAWDRLRQAGWVVEVQKGKGPKATLWEIVVDPQRLPVGQDAASSVVVDLHRRGRGAPSRRSDPLTHPRAHRTGGVRDSGTKLRASHDAFRTKALGPLGYRIIRYLDRHGPSSVAEIAEALGCDPGHVSRVLRTRLGAVGLVERLSAGRWGLLAEDVEPCLDWAAERFETAGVGAQMRRLHQWEREEYRKSPSWGTGLGWWDQWEASRRTVVTAAA